MPKFTDRTGEFTVNKQGLRMEIVRYANANDIDVVFETGDIARNKRYQRFKSGDIVDTKFCKDAKERIGQTNVNNQGLKMTIIAYRGYDDIDVQFEDGYIKHGSTYQKFKNGMIKNNGHIENRVGEQSMSKLGQRMVIKAYRGSKDIDVEFEDGTTREHVSYEQFKRGGIANPNYLKVNSRIGKTNKNNKGILMRIKRYRGANDIDIEFEDGIVVKSTACGAFETGQIRHPKDWGTRKVTDKYLCRWAYQEDEVDYFMCYCKQCGKKFIATMDELKKHKCN